MSLLITEYENLTLFTHIEFIDETATEHLVLVNLRVYRIDAGNGSTDILFAVTDDGTGLIDGASFVEIVAEVRLGGGNVARLDADVTTLFQSLIGF